jgi:formamidopyrimidine-DNA glycosylase
VPELPEVETIVRTLAPHIDGRSIKSAEFPGRRVRPDPVPNLNGEVVRAVRRYGKQIVWELDGGYLHFQLRMTGLLLWRTTPGAYTRAVFRFPGGAVCFDDIRQFGSVRYEAEFPDHLGPDPLTLPPSDFARRLSERRRRIKPVLLDQHVVRGLGNIYVDEVLHRARIHPTVIAATLSRARIERLRVAIREVLEAAIAAGGSSISDYVDAEGRPGSYQQQHQVYGRAGQPCAVCSAPIRRVVVAQRGTHYCPRCQRH